MLYRYQQTTVGCMCDYSLMSVSMLAWLCQITVEYVSVVLRGARTNLKRSTYVPGTRSQNKIFFLWRSHTNLVPMTTKLLPNVAYLNVLIDICHADKYIKIYSNIYFTLYDIVFRATAALYLPLGKIVFQIH